MKYIIPTLFLSLLLVGCGTVPKPVVVIQNKPIAIPTVQIAPMTLKPVQWQVYTLAELKAKIAELEKTNSGAVFYIVDQQNFDALAFNLSDMKRYIMDQKSKNDFLVQAIQINNQTAKQ